MTAPPRFLDDQSVLPPELMRALNGAPGEPSQQELAALANELGSAVGVALAAPVIAKALPAPVVAKAALSGGTTLGVSAAKPLAVLGAWVLGGVAVGAGLSAGAYSFARTDDPAPQAVPVVSAAVRTVPREPIATVAEAVVAAPREEPESDVRAPERATASGQASAAEPAKASAAETEISLLKRARAATLANPARALALTAEHAKLYPGGALEQEREVIAVDALLRLGRRDEAAQRAKQFQERYPGSAHARRMGTLATGG